VIEKTKEMFCQAVYERALLSYCFESVDNYYVIASAVSDQDFLRPEHRLVWIIMGSLIKRGVSKFDGSLITNEAVHNGVIKDIGGYDYVNAVIGMDISNVNVQYYIDKVLDASTKFQLYMRLQNGLTKIGSEATNDDVSSADLLGLVGKDVMDLSLKSKAVKEATNLSDGLDEYIEERRNNPIEFCGLSTGYKILDKRIDGLVPGTLTVICARPKLGKSTFLCNIGSYVAYKLLKPVLYVDTEMDFDQWRSRMLSMMSGVDERRIKHGGYTDQEYFNIQQASDLIKKGNLFHEYMPGYSVDKLAAVYNKYKHVEDIGLAVFDYIKEPPGGSKDKNRKEYQLLGDVTTALKDMSGELQIPFLCANQLNRQHDIADSDRILRYADVLMFFKHRELEEMDRGGIRSGGHKLVITNSRRGGTTPEEGIGYEFLKRTLQLSEAEVQLIDYDSKEYKEKEEIEYDTDSTESSKSVERF
jgi:replicative DNA helicase